MAITTGRKPARQPARGKLESDPRQMDLFTAEAPGARLRSGTIGCQLAFAGIGVRRSIEEAIKEQVAQSLDTHAEDLVASYKLFAKADLTDVTSTKGALKAFWMSYTLPYIEPGVRLLPHAQLQQFQLGMTPLMGNFATAVAELQGEMPQIKARRKEALGELYDETDYPDDVREHFSVSVSYPTLEPPGYLMKLDPALYQQEAARVKAQMTQAASLAETVFTAEMLKIVKNLRTSIANTAAGKQKCFKDSSANHVFKVLADFQTKMAPFGIASDGPLSQCLVELKALVGNHNPSSLPEALRNEEQFRTKAVEQFGKMEGSLTKMLETRMTLRRRVSA